MKFKVIFNSYKPIPYTETVSGKKFIFGFVNITKAFEMRKGSLYNQMFAKLSVYSENINQQLKDFLETIESDFWLDVNERYHTLMHWKEGPIIAVDLANTAGVSPSVIEHFENERFLDLYSSYSFKLQMLTFTELMILYWKFKTIKDSSNDRAAIDSLHASIYQYLWATNWFIRRKVLAILADEPFNVNYRKLEEAYIYLDSHNWSHPDISK